MRWSYPDLLATPDPVIDTILAVMTEEGEQRRREDVERERRRTSRRR
jgi:hypothetical protein